MEKTLFNIFKPSLGRISCALRTHHWSQKKELQSYSYIQSPAHCILLWGPHYRNHSTAIHWYVFNYLYFFTLLSVFLVAFTSVTSLLYMKSQGGKEKQNQPARNLGKHFSHWDKSLQPFILYNSWWWNVSPRLPPGLLSYVSLDCASVCLLAQPVLIALGILTNRLNDVLSLGTHYLMPGGKKKGLLC